MLFYTFAHCVSGTFDLKIYFFFFFSGFLTPTTLAAVQAAQAAHVAAAQQQHFGNFQAPQQQPSHPNPQSSQTAQPPQPEMVKPVEPKPEVEELNKKPPGYSNAAADHPTPIEPKENNDQMAIGDWSEDVAKDEENDHFRGGRGRGGRGRGGNFRGRGGKNSHFFTQLDDFFNIFFFL